MVDIPVVVTLAGATPTPPATLLAELIASVSATNPGYTATLPGSLIEDISSTDVGALVLCDSGRVELLNSLTPFASNDFMLSQLGQIYIGPGAAPAPPTNTSVSIVFTGTVGFVIAVGFTVSDGTHQYIVQDGGVIGQGGTSEPLFCLASTTGSWSVPANTVTILITSVPSVISLSCTNPLTGVSGGIAETAAQYRARVMQAGQAVGTGIPTLLKTLLGNVSGVQQRLISVAQQVGGWTVICGGGDPYQVAYAIYAAGLNIAGLVGATLAVTNITVATNAQITTATNHNYAAGQVAQVTGVVGMASINGVSWTVETIIDEKNFTISLNTSSYAPYVSGGVLTPNLINQTPAIYDYPDTYVVPFVSPPAQAVTISITWQTTSANFVSAAAIAQAGAPAVAAYVNSVNGGQPMSVLEIQAAFLAAVENILDTSLFSSLVIAASINGVSTPATGELIIGDPWSYFSTDPGGSGISIVQG